MKIQFNTQTNVTSSSRANTIFHLETQFMPNILTRKKDMKGGLEMVESFGAILEPNVKYTVKKIVYYSKKPPLVYIRLKTAKAFGRWYYYVYKLDLRSISERSYTFVTAEDKILTLEQAREMEDFYEYQNGAYEYKEDGIVRLIHKGKDYAEGLGAKWVGCLQCNDKNELTFAFRTEKGCGVRYNGNEIFKEEWKWVGT